ncbi:MAG: CYTH domain-containing protein [Fermentimonas sp.]|jgi:adenylate cyclase
MGFEIERKFLVKGDFKSKSHASYVIKQGYLSFSATSVTRVRVRDDKGFITIKSQAVIGEIKRSEWEYEIPVQDALDMLKLCDKGLIDKRRFLVEVGSHTFEVDEFYGDNEGLVVAEVELGSEDEYFESPDWLGEEVTGDPRYYNSSLVNCPYKDW